MGRWVERLTQGEGVTKEQKEEKQRSKQGKPEFVMQTATVIDTTIFTR